MSTPTFPQMQHFYRLVAEGCVTSANFQAFLQNPARFLAGFPISYDQDIGLVPLIERAVGPNNLGNINRDITPARFKLAGTGVRSVTCRVEPYRNGETSEEIYDRLKGTVPGFGNTGDLAEFLHAHPEEVEKWPGWVLAISEDSRWADSDGRVLVPGACVGGARRGFGLFGFRGRLGSGYGILVVLGE